MFFDNSLLAELIQLLKSALILGATSDKNYSQTYVFAPRMSADLMIWMKYAARIHLKHFVRFLDVWDPLWGCFCNAGARIYDWERLLTKVAPRMSTDLVQPWWFDLKPKYYEKQNPERKNNVEAIRDTRGAVDRSFQKV